MRFSLISSVLAALSSVAIAAPAVSQPGTAELTTRSTTAPESVDTLGDLSRKAQALQKPAHRIKRTSGPAYVAGQGPFPKIINGMNDISKDANNFKTKYAEGETVFDEEGCNTIATSYRKFVDVNQELLNILISRAHLFRAMPYIGDAMSPTLKQLGGRYSDLGKFFVEHCEGKLEGDFQDLSATVTKAINAYKAIV